MSKMSKSLIPGFVFALIFLSPLHAQRAPRPAANPNPAPVQAPADSNPAAADPAPAGQAPDEMTRKITDLVHAGKYAEAQKLTTGLLAAYPDDQRLIKAKELLEKLLAPSGLANATPSNNQPERGTIGLGVSSNPPDGSGNGVLVMKVFPGWPAEQGGLKEGDAITSVGGKTVTSGAEVVAEVEAHHPGDKLKIGYLRHGKQRESTVVVSGRQKLNNQPTNDVAPAQPATNANAEQLSGRERLDYDALIELVRQAQESADVGQQRASLQQFMDESSLFLQKHPAEMLLWQLRAATAISLNDPMAGYEAGQKLLAAGAADSTDSDLRRLLGQLKNKGWMDRQGVAEARQKIAEGEKYDWLIGTWQGTSSWFSKAAFDYGNRQANMKVEFIKSGSGIEGYVYNQSTGAPFKVPGLKYTARNAEEINLSTNWKTEWKKEWRPISSFALSSDKKTMTIVYQSVETRTLVLTKIGD